MRELLHDQKAGMRIQALAIYGLQDASEAYLVEDAFLRMPLCDTRKACNNNAEGHPVGSPNSWRKNLTVHRGQQNCLPNVNYNVAICRVKELEGSKQCTSQTSKNNVKHYQIQCGQYAKKIVYLLRSKPGD